MSGMDEHLRAVRSQPLTVGGKLVASPYERARWRKMSEALERGTLDEIMDAIQGRGELLTAQSIVAEMESRGE